MKHILTKPLNSKLLLSKIEAEILVSGACYKTIQYPLLAEIRKESPEGPFPSLLQAVSTYFLGPFVLFCSFLLFQTLFFEIFLLFQFSLLLSPDIENTDQIKVVVKKWKINSFHHYSDRIHLKLILLKPVYKRVVDILKKKIKQVSQGLGL